MRRLVFVVGSSFVVGSACIPPELTGGTGGAASLGTTSTVGPGSTSSGTSGSPTSSSGSSSGVSTSGGGATTSSSAAGTGGSTATSSSTGAATSSVSASSAASSASSTSGLPATPVSCLGKPTGGDTSCGPQGNADCCDTIAVPGGTFNRSNDPMAPATVSSFWLDRFEMTVGRFRALIANLPTAQSQPAAGYGARPTLASSGWDAALNNDLPANSMARLQGYTQLAAGCVQPNYSANAGAKEHLPINCVPWVDAFLACAADGGYLPTEAEWNYAAAGGTEQRQYPWGASSPDPMHAIYGNAAIAAVGSTSPTGDGKWGHSDLAGNVREWTLDWSDNNYLLPCIDCAETTMNGKQKVMRGGSYASNAAQLPTTMRDPQNLTSGTSRGIRCVRFP